MMTSEEWLIGFGVIPDKRTIEALDVALKEQREACGDEIMKMPVCDKREFKFREIAAYSCLDARIVEKEI